MDIMLKVGKVEEYHKAKHKYNVRKNNANLNTLKIKSKSYRREIKKNQNKHRINIIKELIENKIHCIGK